MIRVENHKFLVSIRRQFWILNLNVTVISTQMSLHALYKSKIPQFSTSLLRNYIITFLNYSKQTSEQINKQLSHFPNLIISILVTLFNSNSFKLYRKIFLATHIDISGNFLVQTAKKLIL